MPIIGDRLVYTNTINVKQHTKAMLDTAAKRWFISYFKIYRPDTLSKDKDPQAFILKNVATEFKMTTHSMSVVKYKFYLIMTLKITCEDNTYSYKIFDIFFTPESKLFRSIGYYQSSPEYLLRQYKKEHLGVEPAIDMGRKKIAEYLTNVNNGVLDIITSLNKAMVN